MIVVDKDKISWWNHAHCDFLTSLVQNLDIFADSGHVLCYINCIIISLSVWTCTQSGKHISVLVWDHFSRFKSVETANWIPLVNCETIRVFLQSPTVCVSSCVPLLHLLHWFVNDSPLFLSVIGQSKPSIPIINHSDSGAIFNIG